MLFLRGVLAAFLATPLASMIPSTSYAGEIVTHLNWPTWKDPQEFTNPALRNPGLISGRSSPDGICRYLKFDRASKDYKMETELQPHTCDQVAIIPESGEFDPNKNVASTRLIVKYLACVTLTQ